jgi:hypothetical protein
VSYLVGYGMLREMGALMTGIIMAGRTGAAFAAELGSMKITEEIDAYTTLGISPVDHLVLPRMLGPVRDDAAAGDLRQLRRHRGWHGGGHIAARPDADPVRRRPALGRHVLRRRCSACSRAVSSA